MRGYVTWGANRMTWSAASLVQLSVVGCRSSVVGDLAAIRQAGNREPATDNLPFPVIGPDARGSEHAHHGFG